MKVPCFLRIGCIFIEQFSRDVVKQLLDIPKKNCPTNSKHINCERIPGIYLLDYTFGDVFVFFVVALVSLCQQCEHNFVVVGVWQCDKNHHRTNMPLN